ncbi:MAG: SOS response-associated peptidase, partial [Bdellovibrionota bacterium]
MCATSLLIARAKKLGVRFRVLISDDFETRVMPFGKGPAVLAAKQAEQGGEREMVQMQFSLIPHWSKERKQKFSTHNARLEDPENEKSKWIYEKPTWKIPFSRRHCLIPMTAFVEASYWGPLAGNMLQFASKDGEILAAAAIWNETVMSDGEIVQSYSILTDEPLDYVYKHGHHRSPVFLSEKSFDEWLSCEEREPKDWVKFLRRNLEHPELVATVERAMKPGWEKRIPKEHAP